MKNKILGSIIILIVIITLISGCIDTRNYTGKNPDTKACYEQNNRRYEGDIGQSSYDDAIKVCDNVETMESYHFTLKEMKQKDLIEGQISGSFLLIGGSIYGRVEEKMYLAVTYYDTRVNAYKITKFNLEEMEINTIGKNETPYWVYRVEPYKYYESSTIFYYDRFKPVLYLPEGWAIL